MSDKKTLVRTAHPTNTLKYDLRKKLDPAVIAESDAYYEKLKIVYNLVNSVDYWKFSKRIFIRK